MLVTLNKKPIRIEEEPTKQPINWIYTSVSTTGFLFALSVLDYVCYTFCSIHPIPLIKYLTSIILTLL